MGTKIIWGKFLIKNDGSDPAGGIIENGALFVQGDEIFDLGTYKEIRKKYSADEIIGNSDQVILPGLVNGHYHGKGLTCFQLGTDDGPLEIWRMYWRTQKRVDPYWDTLYAAMKLIDSGVTTTVHSHSTVDPGAYEEEAQQTLRAYENAGIRVAFALDIKDQNSFVYEDDRKFIATLPKDLGTELETFLSKSPTGIKLQLEDIYFSVFEKISKKYQGKHGKINIFLGPVSPVWVSDPMLLRIKEKAKEQATGIHMHCLETYYQRQYGFKKYGKSSIEHLHEIGVLGPEVSLAHCVWLTEKDIDLLSETGTSVVHNAGSNLRLRSGVAPVLKMLEKGVNTGIGIDGITLNDTDDLLEEMRLCSKLHWMLGMDKDSLSPLDVLRMATTAGAKIAQFKDIGVLKKGFKADLILIDLKRLSFPYLEARKGIFDVILAKGNSATVDTVLIGGEVFKRNKKLVKFDKGKIIRELKNSLKGEKGEELVALENFMKRVEPYIKKFYRDGEMLDLKPFYRWNSRI
jgi:cytosine/adenosine deaminase-related metal-dependent hydrolase